MRHTQKHVSTMVACAAALLALAACGEDEAAKAAAAASARQAQAAFVAAQKPWRDERHAELTQPDGWTSLVGLHWIDPGAHYLGSDADNGIRLAMGPAHLGMLDRKNAKLRFVPERGVAVTLDGASFKGSTALRADDDAAGPSKLGFDDGKGVATVIKRGDRYALRVKHADAPTRTGFKGIDYWPGGADWKLSGKFVAHPAGKTIPIANIIGTTDETPNPGVVEFERDGKPYRLEALDQGDGGLFLVFADRTSGHGSYGAGRFLDAPKPDAQGRVALDFNQSYNPPCAFTPFATCPLPPPENRLDLAIAAGEKNYLQSKP
ncbi:DUF1684 domain-containing protein [Lysobacter koreensis]|uniref:DUF1684 domain-containing protein n=1 Tax=Lysobacter koreensis TaxID=266122 RepID=A0ABW2YJV8_9GAMM